MNLGAARLTESARDERGSPRFTLRGFTLLEVMVAAGILFICLFAILGLLANTLRNARALQNRSVDAGMLAAELSLTNKLYEGEDSGDFGELYPDYRWSREVKLASTNGLFQVDFTVTHRSRNERPTESHMSVLMFRPESPVTPGALGGGR
jgi:Tfp pilus assembly protein PilV